MFEEIPKRPLNVVPDDTKAKIMRCIELGYARDNRCPSLKEITSFCGFESTRGVVQHIDKLIEDGYLIRLKGEHRGRGKGRNIRLTEKRYFF